MIVEGINAILEDVKMAEWHAIELSIISVVNAVVHCGADSKEMVQALTSREKKTYFSYDERKALLESIRYVDLVIPEENWQQKRTDMHEYHVDIFVMGDDWKGKFDFLKEEGVEVVYLPRTPEISSSKIKKDLYDANAVDGESKIFHDDINTDPQ